MRVPFFLGHPVYHIIHSLINVTLDTQSVQKRTPKRTVNCGYNSHS